MIVKRSNKLCRVIEKLTSAIHLLTESVERQSPGLMKPETHEQRAESLRNGGISLSDATKTLGVEAIFGKSADGISLSDAAKLLDVNRATVWRWVKAEGLGSSRGNSRKHRLSLSDIEQLRKRHKHHRAWRESDATVHQKMRDAGLE